ncbi:MAG: hypothetical protein II969_12885 [Anaerolineaceae bacterium]|nr:hypothetical protein [Anaerolineaceae bacterium]
MSSDIMNACADMILTDAIEDLANEENISLAEARNRILNSKAYACLYDFETDLWQEGPDYFLDFFRGLEQKKALL